MKVIICGDRNWDNYDVISRFLNILPEKTKVIHGGCRGADSIVEEIAPQFGFETKVHLAKWKDGKKAGPIRNRQMVDQNSPDLVVAFHNDLTRSKGTADMIKVAILHRIPYIIINETWCVRD